MKDVIYNTISVERSLSGEFHLFWQDGDGNHSKFICVVHGGDNAREVAFGIAKDQAEFVKHCSGLPPQTT